MRILLTGAAGSVASFLYPRLVRPGRVLRLLDLRTPVLGGAELRAVSAAAAVVAASGSRAGDTEIVVGSITDVDVMRDAMRGVDAVVHLGGQSREAPVDRVLEANMLGTYRVLEAAHRAGVDRVILASSNHAVGYQPRSPEPLPGSAMPRPDSLYGWSKAAMEACGRLYADEYGMNVICLRIGMCLAEPVDLRSLAMWLSPDDCARLVEACLSVPAPGYRIVWGISHNTRRWCSLAEGEAVGYHPQDDAEAYAGPLIARFGEPDWDTDPVLNRVGGIWCAAELGVPF